MGEDWRDGESAVMSNIALSPDGKKVVSGSQDGAVRLWDIDTCKVIAKWTGHTKEVVSICWSRDGRRVLSGSFDGTARRWDVESGETILEPITTGYEHVWAVVYSPDMTLIATGGRNGPWIGEPIEPSVKIWDAKTGKLVATLKGHTGAVRCMAWTKDGKTLISGSYDCSIRTWDTTKWEQTAVLKEHTYSVYALTISPNGRILASVSGDKTARLWNLDNGKPISSPLQHAGQVNCVSFSADGKRLATGCRDKNAYIWDVAAIVKEAGLDDLLSDSKANKSALHADATRHSVQRRPPAYRLSPGCFNGVPSTHFTPRGRPHSSAPHGSTFLSRLFHRSPDAHDALPSSPLDWARDLLKRRRQSGKGIELQVRSPVMEVPYAKGKRRNACAREKRKTKPLRLKTTTTGSSRPPKPGVTQQSGTATQAHPPSQPQLADSSSSTTPTVGDTAIAATSTPSRPDATIRQAGLWARFWLFIGCLSPEYTGDHH
ncbi:WD40 repeat-like protein [Suillus weaverae]|nr:WD40 repeat-like protein [Suillus weaverae]